MYITADNIEKRSPLITRSIREMEIKSRPNLRLLRLQFL